MSEGFPSVATENDNDGLAEEAAGQARDGQPAGAPEGGPEVEAILGSASHVTLYGFNLEEQAWVSNLPFRPYTVDEPDPRTWSTRRSLATRSLTRPDTTPIPVPARSIGKIAKARSSSCKRRSVPRFQFVAMNRLNTENVRENLLGEFEFELSPPYLLYRSSTEVNGIWFFQQEECDDMSALFNSITSAHAKEDRRPGSSRRRSRWRL